MSDTIAQECKCCGYDDDCIDGLCFTCARHNRKLQADRDALLEACKALLLHIGVSTLQLDIIRPNDPPLIDARAAIAQAEKRD